jgi:hypothetical protein
MLLLIHAPVFALVWHGRIVDAETKQALQGVVVTNLVTKVQVLTNEQGQFDMVGNVGEKVSFVCPGYRIQTHLIIPIVEGIRLNFSMRLMSNDLKEFVFVKKYNTQYQIDSAERRSEQSRVLARQKSSIGSPVSFLAERLSRKQRSIFKFQKDFVRMEADQFVDTRYSVAAVTSLTHLGGDTLAYFMQQYPMAYDYARNATALELKMWIRYNLKDFMQKTDSLRNLKLPY